MEHLEESGDAWKVACGSATRRGDPRPQSKVPMNGQGPHLLLVKTRENPTTTGRDRAENHADVAPIMEEKTNKTQRQTSSAKPEGLTTGQ